MGALGNALRYASRPSVLRAGIWFCVVGGAAAAIFGLTTGDPWAAIIAIALLSIAMFVGSASVYVGLIRWVLTGDPRGTLVKTSDLERFAVERPYLVLGKDRRTGAPRSMSVRAFSPRVAAATASDCGIEVAEVR